MGLNRSTGAGSLPVPTSSFTGRDREQTEISTLLSGAAKLITLTGPGGIGKTRLAAEVIRRYRDDNDGRVHVHWVRLARLTKGADDNSIIEEIAHELIGPDFSGRLVWDALLDTCARDTRRTVLVLDSCEHVLYSAAKAVSVLLDTLPELVVLATSRKPLGWLHEHLVPVPPLTHRDALSLFRRRAELTGHPVTGVEQIETAAAICRHVGNNPLYIQLTAARLAHRPPAMILTELTGRLDDSRLRWSSIPRTGVDPRHRGFTDVIDWSYGLCTDAERLLFDRMSVFAAGYDTNPDDPGGTALGVGADLDAVESICSDALDETGAIPSVAQHEIEHLLESLTDHSLVSVSITPTPVRYSLVESLKVDAQHRLRERSTPDVDEPERLAVRHLCYYEQKISQDTGCFASTRDDLADWAHANWSNLVTAVETGMAIPGRSEDALKICLGMIALRVPFTNGSIREMRRRTERCLEATRMLDSRPTDLQIKAMTALTWLALVQGCSEDAERTLDECVTAYLSDPDISAGWRGMADTDIGLPATIEFVWGLELFYIHGDAGAIAVLTRARDKFDDLGHRGDCSLSEMLAALAAGLVGTARQATELTRDYLEGMSVSGTPRDRAWAENTRAIALTREGDFTAASALHRSSLNYHWRSGDQLAGTWTVHHRIWSLARIIAGGNLARDTLVDLATDIAHLSGGVATLRAHLGINLEVIRPVADGHAEAVDIARRVLGSDIYAAAEARGRCLCPEENEVQRLAVGELALDTLSGHQPPTVRVPGSHWRELTLAEQQVAILAAAGWTNPAIAEHRGTSFRTVDAQMAAILHKLAVTSREDIIEHVPRTVIGQVHAQNAR